MTDTITTPASSGQAPTKSKRLSSEHFGKIWNEMLAAGEAPRESMFAERHSDEWHAAREECRRRVEAVRVAKAKRRAEP